MSNSPSQYHLDPNAARLSPAGERVSKSKEEVDYKILEKFNVINMKN
jgi:hypothetical protein